MRHFIVLALGVLLLTLPSRAGDSKEYSEFAKVEAKIEAAKECNVYVHFRKGGEAQCLFDPAKKKAVPLTVFENRSTGEVTLGGAVLKEGGVVQWKVKGADFYAIHKNRRVVIVNLDTGQTGVISLSNETK